MCKNSAILTTQCLCFFAFLCNVWWCVWERVPDSVAGPVRVAKSFRWISSLKSWRTCNVLEIAGSKCSPSLRHLSYYQSTTFLHLHPLWCLNYIYLLSFTFSYHNGFCKQRIPKTTSSNLQMTYHFLRKYLTHQNSCTSHSEHPSFAFFCKVWTRALRTTSGPNQHPCCPSTPNIGTWKAHSRSNPDL